MVTLPPKETPETRQRTLEIFAAAIERVSGGTTDVSRAARLAAETGDRMDISNPKRQFDKMPGAEKDTGPRWRSERSSTSRSGCR